MKVGNMPQAARVASLTLHVATYLHLQAPRYVIDLHRGAAVRASSVFFIFRSVKLVYIEK